MNHSVDVLGDKWTIGNEWEFSDWDCSRPLAGDFTRSPDYTIVNSNGIAAQPNTAVYGFGGEINTPPSSEIREQAHMLIGFVAARKPKINYRSNLHVHIRVPGLKDSLPHLKKLQEYIHTELPKVLTRIDKLPTASTPAELKRRKRNKVSHHTLLTSKRLEHQLAAKSIKEFFNREVPHNKQGKPMWHAQARLAVNIRQLLQTNTIEFRHFFGTLDANKLACAINWCRHFLLSAFNDTDILSTYQTLHTTGYCDLPVITPFDEQLEIKYQATAAHNGLKQDQIKRNIQLILEDKFHGSAAEEEAKRKSGCL